MVDIDGLRRIISEVVADHPVVFSYLFGSYGRGAAHPASDVDVAVRFAADLSRDERFSRTLRIGGQLEAAIGCDVDVVDLAEAPLRLVGRVLVDRLVVTGMDSPARVRFETEQFKLATDFEHHAAALDRQLLKATAEGRR